MNIFELAAKLALDSSDYIKGINEAEKATSSSNDKIKDSVKKTTDSYNQGLKTAESSSNNFGQALKKGIVVAAGLTTAALTATSAAAVAVTKSFIKGIKEAADYGDTVDKQSQKVGLSAKTWQEYDYVLKISGTDMQSVTAGVKTLTNQIDAAKKGNKDAVARFKALGISIKDLKNMSQEDIFKKTIAGLQNMKEGTDRAALANKLFGRSGQELQPLLNMTAKETQGLIDKANELGMVMSDQGVKSSASYKDSLTTLEGAFKGLKNSIMTEFMPGITNITEGLAEVFSGKGSEKLKSGISLFLVELRRVGPDILKIISDVGTSLIKGLGPMLPSVVSTIFSLLTQAITTVSSMTPQLMPSIITGIEGAMSALITALPIVINGVTQLIMGLVSWLSEDGNVQTLANGIVAMVTQLVNSFGMILPVLLPAIVTIISECAKALTQPDNVQMLLDAVLTVIGALAVAIVKSVPIIIDAVKGIILNLSELLSRFLEWAVPRAADGIKAIVDTVKKWFGTLLTNTGNFITNIWNKVSTWFTELPGKIAVKLASVWQGIKTWFGALPGNISSAFKATVDTIKGWATSAVTWGKDMIAGFIKGIKESASKMASVIKNFAKENISKFLHFSVPDAGPLADADKWMPDFVDLMTTGLEKNASKMKAAVKDFAGDIGTNMSFGVESAGNVNGRTTVLNVTMNINASEGQDIRELAKQISRELQNLVNDKESVYA